MGPPCPHPTGWGGALARAHAHALARKRWKHTGNLGPPGTFGNLQETFTTKDIKTPHQNHENEASVDYQDHCTVVPVIGDTSKCTSQMSAF